MSTSYHYNGFIDECSRLGINKSAAAALYKQAGFESMFRTLNKFHLPSVTPLVKGWGKFTGKHPYMGLFAATVPTALLVNSNRDTADKLMTINTLTPSQRSTFDRMTNASGYAGFGIDSDDLDKMRYV